MMSLAVPPRDPDVSPPRLLVLSIPAILVGAVSALILWGLEQLASLLEDVLWGTLPDALGVDPWGWWVILVLTLTGLAVGLGLRFLPGHGGPDSATTELVSEPLRLTALPGLALVTILALAGGVSLGPENPIIAINTALIVALFARLIPRLPPRIAMLLAASATIGALFGTPVAAALVFTGIVAAVREGGSLWDKLFLPVAAAGAGAITMHLLGAPPFAFDIPSAGTPDPLEIGLGIVVVVAATVVALAALAAFPVIYRMLHALRSPIVIPVVGGFVLGILGLIGGEITMFKGLDQMGELITNVDDYDPAQLAAIAGIKIVALLVAASALFRGGRVFPATFIGAALGLLAYALIPGLPMGLALACGVLGIVLVVTRDGWIALFIAVAVAGGDISLLPALCLAVLPAWLLVTGAPEFRIEPPPAPVSEPTGSGETDAAPGAPGGASAR
jgi:H+/Cl- antiporter ClcA